METGIDLTNILIGNPWENVYWFARMLINTDKYGAPGKSDMKMFSLCAALSEILSDDSIAGDEKVRVCKNTILQMFSTSSSEKKAAQKTAFANDINKKILDVEDIKVLILTIKNVVIPISVALKYVPNNDRDFAENMATGYLEALGAKGLANVINLWDDAGTNGCLTIERMIVKQSFANLRRELSKFDDDASDWILTAFVQEFERRLGQKRKTRAGGSLENVASFIFNYFNIVAHDEPEHFKADLEVDKWIQCSDKWLIGISCKRTLRERWKQVSSADRSVLSSYKIKAIWHMITFDEDLSDDKLASLGAQNHIFFLRDESVRLKRYKAHSVLKDYVRPMSSFVDCVMDEQKKTSK